MVDEIPEVIEIGVIKLTPDETFYYTAWGIRYRFSIYGRWRIADMVFRKKSDAEYWMKEKILRFEGMEGEVVPVKRCLLLDESGHVSAWTEELS